MGTAGLAMHIPRALDTCLRMLEWHTILLLCALQIKTALIKTGMFEDTMPCHLASGLGAGFFAVICGSPVDVVKSRLMGMPCSFLVGRGFCVYPTHPLLDFVRVDRRNLSMTLGRFWGYKGRLNSMRKLHMARQTPAVLCLDFGMRQRRPGLVAWLGEPTGQAGLVEQATECLAGA